MKAATGSLNLLPKSLKEFNLKTKSDAEYVNDLGISDAAKMIKAVLNRATADKSLEAQIKNRDR